MTEEKSPAEEPAALQPEPVPKAAFPPVVALAFVVIALLGVLLVMILKNDSSPAARENADLTALQAEADALRAEYNRERIAMGLRPVEGGSEPIEDIVSRLKKDSDALVALAGSYQKMLGETDRDLTASQAEILRAGKLRQSLAAENSRLQGELQRALVNGSESDLLRRDLANLKSQRDALASELAAARDQMKGLSAGIPADDVADLRRRLEETLRAKEFFESRVRELEAAPVPIR